MAPWATWKISNLASNSSRMLTGMPTIKLLDDHQPIQGSNETVEEANPEIMATNWLERWPSDPWDSSLATSRVAGSFCNILIQVSTTNQYRQEMAVCQHRQHPNCQATWTAPVERNGTPIDLDLMTGWPPDLRAVTGCPLLQSIHILAREWPTNWKWKEKSMCFWKWNQIILTLLGFLGIFTFFLFLSG